MSFCTVSENESDVFLGVTEESFCKCCQGFRASFGFYVGIFRVLLERHASVRT